ncbi:MAG: hypothetical protein DI586_03720 [Micavibrio aeruginosavorus]|uniref:Uncharacterized protein n=1 Tax=Micavibrio aeruginosavorus TaxID=349221 RepID=A0A2W5FKH3_9BACT|nr:MAG: hypothetical protein DI586_03720 [Micavibrio aeruginosavorus]
MAFRKLLSLQSKLLKEYKIRDRIERLRRRMVMDMLRKGMTLEKYKKLYERNGSSGLNPSENPCFPRDLSAEALAKAENGGP